MSYTIYSYPDNFRVAKTLIAAKYAGIEIEQPDFEFGKDNKTPSFLAKYPLGKVPAMDTPNGPLFESGAIQRYVGRLRPESGLYGSGFYQNGLVDQWLDFITTEVDTIRGSWLYPIMGYIEFDQEAYEQAKKDMANILSVLDKHFLHNTFMVGNQITLADIALTTSLVELYRRVFAPKFIESYPNVTRWFTTCLHQPNFESVLKTVEFAKQEEMAPKPSKQKKDKEEKKPKEEKPVEDKPKEEKPKKETKPKEDKPKEEPPKEGKPKKEKKEKEDKPKEDTKPKEEKPKKDDKQKGEGKKKEEKPKDDKGKKDDKPKGADDKGKKDDKPKDKPKVEKKPKEEKPKEEPMDDDDEDKPKKKEKNPLDLLPESKMHLDAVKKLFFAEKPFNPSFFNSFWTTFDPAGFSIYTITYNFDDENKILFMTGNAVGGFIQRAEDVRKYAFGTLSIIAKDEETPPYRIVGSWIFRGAGIPKEMLDCDDYSYYVWTKVDSSKADVRKRIEALFTADSLGGPNENVIDRRYFK